MKTHVEIQIRLKLSGSKTLHDVLRAFSKDSMGWNWARKQSEDYQAAHGGPAGYVICEGIEGLDHGIVAIASIGSAKLGDFRVMNIVPAGVSELTITQYNSIGIAFARQFGGWLRSSGQEGSIHASKAELTLADIIPASKCRRYFDRFLNRRTLSTSAFPVHPADIEKLDVFICAVFRYGAAVETSLLERYLVQDLRWKRGDAAFVRGRMDAGLAILAVDRRF